MTDTEVAEALVAAYSARTALGLDPATVARIRSEIALVARGPDYAWPALRLNQLNWYVLMMAADARVNGEDATLASGMARHLARFLGNPRNFGAGLRFHYLPERDPRRATNVDSAEYANIVLGFSRFYTQARAAGMAPPARMALLHDWVRRALAGYWTHSGYLNWDTGLGFGRWQQRKKVPLAAEALIGIAATPELQPSPEWGAWAKWMFDRGLDEYVAQLDADRTVPGAMAYDVHVLPQGRGNAYLAAGRYAANAMRAYDAGLSDAPSAEPPALYSYDPDTGRLAITTPAYNTAIVPINQRAFPYGGLDIARLFDADQRVAGDLGGLGNASFGLHVDGLSTQYGARALGANPLRVDGIGAGRVHAGPFTALRAHGRTAAGAVSYRFTPTAIDACWSTSRHGRATVTFPSWGRGATVSADGAALGRRPVSGIGRLEIHSARSGYVVTPSRPVTARLVRVAPQSSDPEPGPSVEIELGAGPVRLCAQIAVG